MSEPADIVTPCCGEPLRAVAYESYTRGIEIEIQCPRCQKLWNEDGTFESY